MARAMGLTQVEQAFKNFGDAAAKAGALISTPLPRMEFWMAPNGKWYFHKRSRNGQITNPSQGYSSRSNVRRAIRTQFPGIRMVYLDPMAVR